jgi:hypothetical protein
MEQKTLKLLMNKFVERAIEIYNESNANEIAEAEAIKSYRQRYKLRP